IRADFTKFECINQLPEILHIDCNINRTTDFEPGLFVNFQIVEDISNLNGNFNIFFKYDKKTIKYKTHEMDYCLTFANVHKDRILQVVTAGIRRNSNISLSCPFKKNKSYYVNGFTIDQTIIPRYIPKLTFSTELTFISKGRLLLVIKTFGQI
ncbi:hypothetical protein KR222_004619, partial [Zaprionus bogoriensis]